MEFGTHIPRTEVFSRILPKNIAPITPCFFNTYLEKHIFMNLTSLGSQKGCEALRYNEAKFLQTGVGKLFFKQK